MPRYDFVLTIFALLLAACFFLPGGSVHAQQTPVDVQTYEGWLREALVAAQRRDRLGLEQVAEDLTRTSEIQLADEVSVSVRNAWLNQALDTPDPDFEQIATQLGALLDALAQPPQSAPADAQERLDNILNNPPFGEVPPENESLLDRFLNWLLDLLDQLLDPAFEAGTRSGSWLQWILLVVCGSLVVGVLIYLLLQVRHTLTSAAEARPTDDPEAHLTSTSAFQQASVQARGGDYRTAVRYLYLSSLLWLDERGALRYDRALTNREYLERLAGQPELRERLIPIVDTFDRVWYGHVALSAEDFHTYQQQVEALRQPQR